MLIVRAENLKGSEFIVEGETIAECLDKVLAMLDIEWEVVSDTESEQAPKPNEVSHEGS